MILDKVYSDFCNHTGIKDQAYEAVFTRFNSIINRMNNTKWLYLVYNDKDSDQTVNFDLEHNPTIPLYAFDLIKNCFYNYYTLPSAVTVTIGISFQNVTYEVVSTATETKIPAEVVHILEDDLIKLFTLTSPVRDVFVEFDNLFSFFSKFKVPVRAIHPTLEKKFELKDINEEKVDGNLSVQEMSKDQDTANALKLKLNSLLKHIEEIRNERDNLISAKDSIYTDVSARETLLNEKQKLITESEVFAKLRDDTEIKRQRLQGILSSIESELEHMVDNKIATDDIEFIKTKKYVFEKELVDADKELDNYTTYLKGASEGISAIKKELEKIENYKPLDITSAEKRINELNKEQDSTYTLFLTAEQELKTIESKMMNESLKMEKAQFVEDGALSSLENKTLLTHLSSSLQPPSVITVVNYLRYLFAFKTTKIASELFAENPTGNIYIIQAVAARVAMAELFGIQFNNLFSVHDFNHNSVKHLNIIVKE